MTPAERRARHHAAEILFVQLFEELFEVVYRTFGPAVRLSAACLTNQTDLTADVFPVQVEPVSMQVLWRGRPTVEFTEQDMRERFSNRSGRGFEQIGNANANGPAVETYIAVRIGEPLILDVNARDRRTRPYLAMDAMKQFGRRFEEKRAFDVDGPQKIFVGSGVIDHNKRLLTPH